MAALTADDPRVIRALEVWDSLTRPKVVDVARVLEKPERTVHRWIEIGLEARRRDPAVNAGMAAVGTGINPSGMWIKTKPTDDEPGYSVYIRPEHGDGVAFRDLIRETVADACEGLSLDLPKRFSERAGNLLVLDPADVHIGKLSVSSETGFEYNDEIAEHRLVEGSRLLLESAMRDGVTRVLFIIGNDIAHIDTPRRTTTSGTPQDTDGNIFTIYRAAQRAYIRIVRMALEMGLHVDLLFNPSNHDWVLGFTIAQSLGILFADHPNVGTSDYYLSENHRKYYVFERNLIGATHGDGAKERDLGDIMRTEAISHISSSPLLYWYVHHYHHRIRKSLGVRPFEREKDHIGMTVVRTGPGRQEGDGADIMVVRSPSPPDGWHHRNGYINRQAVEAFIHHPFDGRIRVLTEWF